MSEHEEILSLVQADKEDDNSLFSVSGILTGFSFSAVVFSLSLSSTSGLRAAVLGAFLASTIMFLGATIISMLILESITAIQRHLRLGKNVVELKYRTAPRRICYMFFVLGLVSVMIGTTLLGFMYGNFLGVGTIILIVLVLIGVIISASKSDFESNLKRVEMPNKGN